jgi:hypothetical protein
MTLNIYRHHVKAAGAEAAERVAKSVAGAQRS